jgi:hypothetical protein
MRSIDKYFSMTAIAALTIFPLCLPAYSDCPSFEEMESRQARLDSRITAGLESGRLTEKKADHLRKILADVTKREAKCRAGHHMSQFEANRLNEDLDYVSRCISHALKAGRTMEATKLQSGTTKPEAAHPGSLRQQ